MHPTPFFMRPLGCTAMLFGLVLLGLAAPGPGRAQQSTDAADEADVRFLLGNEAYKAKDYRLALSHYFASNRLAPNRNVLFNIARCYEQLKEYVEAYRYYQAYSSPAMTARERRALEKALAGVRPYVALLYVSSDPPGATLYINRRDLGAHGFTPRVLAVAPAKVKIIIELAGYQLFEKEGIEIEAGQEFHLDANLVRIVGQLHLTGAPVGALVRVEDQGGPVAGTLPATLNLSPQEHRVLVTREGFVPREALVRVEAGKTTELEINLAPQTGTLVVQADEHDALVLTDGKPAGFTPTVIDGLLAGKHDLKLQLEGFHPYQGEVVVRPDERVVADVSLQVAEDVEAASRAVEAARNAPASVSLIGRREIEAFGYSNVAEAIRGVRGIYLSDDLTYVSAGVRGFAPLGQYGNRLLVQLDGHTLNDDWLGSSYIEYDLLTELGMLDRIEVVRGPGSALYGTGAFFGVLNLVTPDGLPADRLRGGGSRLDNGAFRLYASGSAPLGSEGGFWASAGGIHAQGQDYFSPSAVGSLSAPDGVAHDVGGFEAGTLMGKAWWRDLALQWYWHQRNKQIPTGAYDTVFGDTRAHSDDARGFGEVRYEPRLIDWAQLLTRVYLDHYFYRGIYPYADPSIGLSQESEASTWLGAEVRTLLTPLDGLRLIVGGGYEYHFSSRAHGQSQASIQPYLDERHPFHLLSAYAVADYTPLDWLGISAGARFDGWWISDLARDGGGKADRFLNSVNPRLAVLFHPVAEGTLKLMGGRAFRAPSIYELTYWDGGVTQIQSPNLEPEIIYTGELEYSHRLPEGFWVTGAVFVNNISSLVEQLGTGTPADPLYYRNQSEDLWTIGAEVELRKEFRRGWMLAAQYSFQRTRVGGLGGQEETNSPEHLASLKLVLPLASHWIRLATRLSVESGRLDRLGKATDPVLLWDLTFSGEVPALHLHYAAGLRNLLDWRYGQPVGDVPDPQVRQRGLSFLVDLNFTY